MVIAALNHPEAAGNLYLHVRVLLGMIVGLGLTHLLRQFARIIEQPRRHKIYWVHMVWALSMFVYLLHFWWWEFRLAGIIQWRFQLYVFIAIYALLLYLLCALILPESIDKDESYRDYFYRRRNWFFGLLALVYVVDYADAWIKGGDYLARLGWAFPVRNALYVGAALIAARTNKARYHASFAIVGLLAQVIWILDAYDVL